MQDRTGMLKSGFLRPSNKCHWGTCHRYIFSGIILVLSEGKSLGWGRRVSEKPFASPGSWEPLSEAATLTPGDSHWHHRRGQVHPQTSLIESGVWPEPRMRTLNFVIVIFGNYLAFLKFSMKTDFLGCQGYFLITPRQGKWWPFMLWAHSFQLEAVAQLCIPSADKIDTGALENGVPPSSAVRGKTQGLAHRCCCHYLIDDHWVLGK